jgi:ABC-type phosphate transport system ATPase subunit
VEDGLSILQYVDDTIIFVDHDIEQARNMKLIICMFEQLSGLKINFHKSEVFFVLVRQRRRKTYIHNYLVRFLSISVPWSPYALQEIE